MSSRLCVLITSATGGEGKTTLQELNNETLMLRHYFSWAGGKTPAAMPPPGTPEPDKPATPATKPAEAETPTPTEKAPEEKPAEAAEKPAEKPAAKPPAKPAKKSKKKRGR